MQPSEFDELDWDEGMDLAERVEDKWAKDTEQQLELLVKLFESHAVAIANSVSSLAGAMVGR